jgi:glycosyltransferase involved in cell wall biosynthesis
VRVGLVTTSYPRFDGDPAGCFVAEHARDLAARGHTVEVIAAGDGIDDQPSAAVRIPGAELFYRGGGPEALERGGSWPAAARFSARLAGEVARRARRWDAIVCHWLIPSALAAMFAAPRRPVLAIAHSGDVHTLRRIGALGPFAALAAARPQVRLSFVSRELRELFLAHAPRLARARLAARSQVCPMGIDLARFRAAPRAPAAAGPTVLFLGRLVPVKGAAVAAAAACRWRSGARLLIAGAGPDEPELRARAAAAPPGRIELVGEVHGAGRDRLLAAADLVVIPSIRTASGRTEGMPMAALEAMATGAPVLASRLGGLADLPVAHVAPGDPSALAAAVDHLLASPPARAALLAAQRDFIADHDWARVGARLDPAPTFRMNHNR